MADPQVVMIGNIPHDQFDRNPMKVFDAPVATREPHRLEGRRVKQLPNRAILRLARVYDAIVDSVGGGDFKNIEDAVDWVIEKGGGNIFVRSGTYAPTRSITINKPISIEGAAADLVTVDMGSTTRQFIVNSGSAYSTGSITSITSGINVTGSGTSWLANVTAGQYLFLGTRWYLIAAVTGDTTMILAEAYGDNLTVPGLAYRVTTLTRGIKFQEMTIKNSTSTTGAIYITDARNVEYLGVTMLTNYIGVSQTNVSETNVQRLSCIASTDKGASITNCGFFNCDQFAVIGNGTGGTASGAVLTNVKYGTIIFSAAESNSDDGFNLTSCTSLYMTVASRANTNRGIQLVSGNTEIQMIACSGHNNGGDAIKLTASSDYCKIIGGHFDTNGAYGVNIAAASCDKTVVTGNSFNSNSSGTVSDSGTGSVVANNTA